MSTPNALNLTTTRPDFAAIAAWIPKGASVLDLGCGDGELLRFLKETRDTRGYGVEISDPNIVACIRNGVSVVQGNLESGLSGFESNAFDFVLLSQTLQATRHTEKLVKEMLRVGREGIVSFPNFGYWKNRLNILLGHMPVSEALPYLWYNTPNIHLCTLHDFENFCENQNITVLERRIMTGKNKILVIPNLLGSTAMYRFKRGK